MNSAADKERSAARDALLADSFHEAWTSGAPAEFARAAARSARRRRAGFRAAAISATFATVALAWAVFVRPASRPSSVPPAPSRTAAVESAPARAPAPAARGYEIISDEELLAQVRDRALLAVTRENGRREIVVLPNE